MSPTWAAGCQRRHHALAQGTDGRLVEAVSSMWWFGCTLEVLGAGSTRPLSLMYSGQRVGCTFTHLLCFVCKPLCPLLCHGCYLL